MGCHVGRPHHHHSLTHTRTHTPLNPPTCTVLPKEIRLPNQVSSVCRLYILRGEMGYQAAPISPLLLEDKGSNILFIFTNILFLFSVLFQLFHNLKKTERHSAMGGDPLWCTFNALLSRHSDGEWCGRHQRPGEDGWLNRPGSVWEGLKGKMGIEHKNTTCFNVSCTQFPHKTFKPKLTLIPTKQTHKLIDSNHPATGNVFFKLQRWRRAFDLRAVDNSMCRIICNVTFFSF